MRGLSTIAVFFVFAVSICAEAQAQFTPVYESIAITEFMTTPSGESDGREWIELYNFGKDPVDLKGFRLTDNGNGICDIPGGTVKPNDFAIVVLGHDRRRFGEDRKKLFEAEWLGGKADDRVVAIEQGNYTLARNGTLILQNRRRTPLWILGWKADDRAGMSTYLAIDDFRIRNYGTAEKPAIDRAGLDGTVLGYEGQQTKQEEVAYKSDVAKLEEVGGFLYKSKASGGENEPSIGSPLKGKYAPMK